MKQRRVPRSCVASEGAVVKFTQKKPAYVPLAPPALKITALSVSEDGILV